MVRHVCSLDNSVLTMETNLACVKGSISTWRMVSLAEWYYVPVSRFVRVCRYSKRTCGLMQVAYLGGATREWRLTWCGSWLGLDISHVSPLVKRVTRAQPARGKVVQISGHIINRFYAYGSRPECRSAAREISRCRVAEMSKYKHISDGAAVQ